MRWRPTLMPETWRRRATALVPERPLPAISSKAASRLPLPAVVVHVLVPRLPRRLRHVLRRLRAVPEANGDRDAIVRRQPERLACAALVMQADRTRRDLLLPGGAHHVLGRP